MVTVQPTSDPDDRRLAGLFLDRGDEAAFRAIYRRHAPGLNSLLLRLCRGNKSEAEEALQECWLRAVEGLASFRWESSLRTWIRAIAVNCARERRRRGLPEEAVETDEISAPAIETAIHPIDLERAISELPDGFRDVFVLHDVEGHTHEEIGRMLGIAAGTSKSQLSRARAALRAQLGAAKERNDGRVARR